MLINDSHSGEFKLEREIRQGDSLSLFLYLIVAEGLSLLVSKAVETNIIEAVEVGVENIKVSHLQYADDTIFTCTGKMDNVRGIKNILRNFELMSGLKVNFNKCSIWGINVEHNLVERMADALGCEVGSPPFLYLGLKIGINHMRATLWNNLIDRIRRRLTKWNGRYLSLGGRITLTQAVLSTIPIYCLSFNRLPKKTLKAITKLQRDFLWGGAEKSSKIPWVKWEEICKEKEYGGLGIKDLDAFNLVLLGKWIWEVMGKNN